MSDAREMKKTFLVEDEERQILFKVLAKNENNLTTIKVIGHGLTWDRNYQGRVMASLAYNDWTGDLKINNHENDLLALKTLIHVFDTQTNPGWLGKLRLWELSKENK